MSGQFPHKAFSFLYTKDPGIWLDLMRVRCTELIAAGNFSIRLHNNTRSTSPSTLSAELNHLPIRDNSLSGVLFEPSSLSIHPTDYAPFLAECARVLGTSAPLVLFVNERDNSVPWVQRLIRIMQDVETHAMSGKYDSGLSEIISENKEFTRTEQTQHRNYVGCTKTKLLDMVTAWAVERKLESVIEELTAEVGALYDEYARPYQPLSLPFITTVTTWTCLSTSQSQDHPSIKLAI